MCHSLSDLYMKVRKKVITKKGGILYFNYRRSEWSLLSKLVITNNKEQYPTTFADKKASIVCSFLYRFSKK
jgi:hypothetical protein